MKRRSFGLTAIAILAITLAGCGGSETATTQPAPEPEKALAALPSEDVALAAVSEAPELGEYKFTRASYSLPMQASFLKGAAREAAEDLAKAGWVFLDESGNLILTQKVESDKRFIVRDNGTLDIVPLAKKEFVSLDGMGHDEEGDVTVDFTWRWLPNDVATSFERGAIATRFDGDRKARATIYSTKDGWKVMRIVEIEMEAPAEAEETAPAEE